MNRYSAQLQIPAPTATIAGVLRNVSGLPGWNPALLGVSAASGPARRDHPYPVTTRLPGSGSLTYLLTEDERVVWVLRAAGSVERAEWILAPTRSGTLVTHTMLHSGTVFALLRSGLQQAPVLRLARLAARMAQDSGTKKPPSGDGG